MNHEGTETQRSKLNELSHRVIGLCLEVHRELGPGLLESAYEEALAYEIARKRAWSSSASVRHLCYTKG